MPFSPEEFAHAGGLGAVTPATVQAEAPQVLRALPSLAAPVGKAAAIGAGAGILAGAAAGAASGASFGSVVPGFGTAVGAAVGTAVGAALGAVRAILRGSGSSHESRSLSFTSSLGEAAQHYEVALSTLLPQAERVLADFARLTDEVHSLTSPRSIASANDELAKAWLAVQPVQVIVLKLLPNVEAYERNKDDIQPGDTGNPALLGLQAAVSDLDELHPLLAPAQGALQRLSIVLAVLRRSS